MYGLKKLICLLKIFNYNFIIVNDAKLQSILSLNDSVIVSPTVICCITEHPKLPIDGIF